MPLLHLLFLLFLLYYYHHHYHLLIHSPLRHPVHIKDLVSMPPNTCGAVLSAKG